MVFIEFVFRLGERASSPSDFPSEISPLLKPLQDITWIDECTADAKLALKYPIEE